MTRASCGQIRQSSQMFSWTQTVSRSGYSSVEIVGTWALIVLLRQGRGET